MFGFFKAGQEQAANDSPGAREAFALAKEGEDNWSEDPQEKVVQLTRQLKVARGQLDKKSDFCDELANQLRRLEEDLEARDSAARETRALLNATGAEFRAAAHIGASERQEYAQATALLQQRLGALESEVEELRGKSQEHSVLASNWLERESQLQRSEAELESQARANTVKLNRLGALISDEEGSVVALSAQLGESREHMESELQHAELERTRHVTVVEEAAQAHLTGETESFAQRLRVEAAELQRALADLSTARTDGLECSMHLRNCEEGAAAQESSAEESLRRIADEKISAIQKAESMGSALEVCRAELISSKDSLRGDLDRQIEICSQLRKEHADEVRAAKANSEEHASASNSLDESREEIARLHKDLESRCHALRTASVATQEQQEELQETRTTLLAECAATSRNLVASEERLAVHVQELANTEEAFQNQRGKSQKLILDVEQLQAEAIHKGEKWQKFEQQTFQRNAEALSTSQAACTQFEQKSHELQGHVEELQAELVSKATKLQELADRLEHSESKQRSALEAEKKSKEALQAEVVAHGAVSEHCNGVTKQLEEQKAAATAAAAQTITEGAQLAALIQDLREQLESAHVREKELTAALDQEKELHDNALKLLQHQRADNQSESNELQQEMEHLSSELEQKEEDLLSTHFDMVALQNKLNDQMNELTTNTEDLRQSKEQLAEKDEKLRVALKRQDELVTQMNEACTRLQEKVSGLSRELESSRAAYQALDHQSRAVIARLECDRESLTNELEHVRAELQGLSAKHEQTRADATERLEAARAKHGLEFAEAADAREASRKLAQQAQAEKQQLQIEMAKQEALIAQEHSSLIARCEAAEKEHAIAADTVNLREFAIKELQTRCDEVLERTSTAAEKHESELDMHRARISALHEELTTEQTTAEERYKSLSLELDDVRQQAAKHKLHASNLDDALEHHRKEWAVESSEARTQADQEVAALNTELKQREDTAAVSRSELEAELRSAQQSVERRHRDLESEEAAGAAANARVQELMLELKEESSRSRSLAQCVDGHELRYEAKAAELQELQQGHTSMKAQHQATAELLHSADEEKSSLLRKSEFAAAEADSMREELQVQANALRQVQGSLEEEVRTVAARRAAWEAEEALLAEARRAGLEQTAALELLGSQSSSLARTLEVRTQEATALREELAEHSTRSQRQISQAQAALQRSEAEGASLQEHLAAREVELQHALEDARKRMEKHALGAADEAAAWDKKLAQQAVAAQQREAALADSLRLEADKARKLQERMLEAMERRDEAMERLHGCEAALERSRLLERQALEKAQELRTSLYLFREFGREDFMHDAPRPAVASADSSIAERARVAAEPTSAAGDIPAKDVQDLVSEGASALPTEIRTKATSKAKLQPPARLASLDGPMSSNLITVELDLGLKSATVSVAIWHTRDDFDTIVEDFLKENRVKLIFKDALVKYLIEVEDEAITLPISVKANLSDVYSRFA